jgi:hypothetical protein
VPAGHRKGKGKEGKLNYQASTMMENHNGLLVGVDVRCATGTSEREGALGPIDEMLLGNVNTLGASHLAHATQSYRFRVFTSSLVNVVRVQSMLPAT